MEGIEGRTGMMRDINLLWKDIYPHLANHIVEVYGRRDGVVLEVGPFCGVIFEFARKGIGEAHCIACFPDEMLDFYRNEAERYGTQDRDRVRIVTSSPALAHIADETVDLVIFRGAFFFPDLFTIDHRAIWRVLKPGGTAFTGGGFGRYTPDDAIRPIAQHSRDLNLRLGKIEVGPDNIATDLTAAGLMKDARIVTEGGLWVIMRKP